MNLYVGNISSAVQPAELQQAFADFGQVLYARLAAEAGAKNTGFAYVYVPSEEQARTAMAALNGKDLKGEKLTVSRMTERPGVVGAAKK